MAGYPAPGTKKSLGRQRLRPRTPLAEVVRFRDTGHQAGLARDLSPGNGMCKIGPTLLWALVADGFGFDKTFHGADR